VQRQRETGEIAPRRQTKFAAGSWRQEERLTALITARPGASLAGVAAGVADHGRVEHVVADESSWRSRN
jgi:hypothetical protein